MRWCSHETFIADRNAVQRIYEASALLKRLQLMVRDETEDNYVCESGVCLESHI